MAASTMLIRLLFIVQFALYVYVYGVDDETVQNAECVTMDKRPRNRLIVAMDGTHNKPYNEGGHPTSNIVRLIRAVKPQADDGATQVVMYNWGIGTEEPGYVTRAVSWMTGRGIDADIINCYRHLVHNYAAGVDLDIFLVGFSRGAFTALSLAGMVDHVGILHKEKLKGNIMGEAYETYTKHKENKKKLQEFQNRTAAYTNVTIKFLGLFDTVGALMTEKEKSKHTRHCPGSVENVFHAVSIDENRKEFEVTLLDGATGTGLDGGRKPCGNLREIWFPGAHSDVGGGFEERKLSNRALRVMMQHMAEHGVQFYDDYEGMFDHDTYGTHEKSWYQWLRIDHRAIPRNATFDESVYDILSNSTLRYKDVCNPNLANVDDPKIKRYFA